MTDTGLVERKANLLKIKGAVIEGRYFSTGRQLIRGPVDVIPGQTVQHPPFMKVGSGPEVVNRGSIGPSWPNMHDEMIQELGLDISSEEYNNYIGTLVNQEANHIIQKLDESNLLNYVEARGLSIDIAWDEHEKVAYTKANGQVVQLPKPLLIEWNFI
jgi:hypothetical protein